MAWEDYIKSMLEHQTVLNDLAISVDGEQMENLPQILMASVLMTDTLLKSGKKNMFVFPEQEQTSFIYVLLRTLHNINEGRIKKAYNPYDFIPGEKLKYKNCVVEFVEIEEGGDGTERLWVRTNNLKHGFRLETAPFFQHVTTKQLSSDTAFSKLYHQFLRDNALDSSKAFMQQLSNYKTHLDCSTAFVAPILSTKKKLLEAELDDKKISDFLLLAQSDIEGSIKNLASGQLTGTPAIVLCQDLYTVCEAIESGLEVNGVYIEATQTLIDNQLDALDDLISQDKSIVILADQMSFTDISGIESRGFKIWTWNEKTIPIEICSGNSRIDIMSKNSATRKIRYVGVQCQVISESISLLYKNKKYMEEQSADIVRVYQDLFEISLLVLRAVSPLTNETRISGILGDCKEILGRERAYLKPEIFNELSTVTDNLESICMSKESFPKICCVAGILNNTDAEMVYSVVPQNVDKNEVAQYMNTVSKGMPIEIIVIYPHEYLRQKELTGGLTIVSGWLNRTTMNRIINANITDEIVIPVYEIERQWKNNYIRNIGDQIKRSHDMNKTILMTIGDSIHAAFEEYEAKPMDSFDDEEVAQSDELEEIELTLSQNKYRRYISQTKEDSVLAIPVSFVGDIIAFYRTGRTLLTATRLINEDYDKIEEVKPAEIQVGDFIIERETQRDIIRDIADILLQNSGYANLRIIAERWKEALEVAFASADEDKIYEKLQSAGCMRGRMAVHNWLNDNNMISPKSKKDIVFIAQATNDNDLLNGVDDVFEAGKTVKNAHIRAGHHLADKLRKKLATVLASKGSIDGSSVWEPIEIHIEDIGLVNLLKVVDVGPEVLVDATSTNKLIDINKVTM